MLIEYIPTPREEGEEVLDARLRFRLEAISEADAQARVRAAPEHYLKPEKEGHTPTEAEAVEDLAQHVHFQLFGRLEYRVDDPDAARSFRFNLDAAAK